MAEFKLVSPYAPTGDQPQAIEALVDGVNAGMKAQTLLGVFLVGTSEVLFTGHEGHAIAGVDLDVNGRSGSSGGHEHASGGEKSNELFHSVIPLKKVGSKLNLWAWKFPLFPQG